MISLRLLGCNGGIGGSHRQTTCYLLGESTIIDSGTGLTLLDLPQLAQEVLHDALCVKDSNRELGEVENESNGDFLGMAISVCSLAGRANKAARCKSIFCYLGFHGYLHSQS